MLKAKVWWGDNHSPSVERRHWESCGDFPDHGQQAGDPGRPRLVAPVSPPATAIPTSVQSLRALRYGRLSAGFAKADRAPISRSATARIYGARRNRASMVTKLKPGNCEKEFTGEGAPDSRKVPAVWDNPADSIVHRAVGATIHPGIRLMWTACGQLDIPAGAAYLDRDPESHVTCPECRKQEGWGKL